MTGYDAAEVIGKDPKFLASGRSDLKWGGHHGTALENKQAGKGEVWDWRKDGSISQMVDRLSYSRCEKVRHKPHR